MFKPSDDFVDAHARCQTCDGRYRCDCPSIWPEQEALGEAVAHALCAPGCADCGQPANGDYRCLTCADSHAAMLGFVRGGR